jgi:hypothetical protein
VSQPDPPGRTFTVAMPDAGDVQVTLTGRVSPGWAIIIGADAVGVAPFDTSLLGTTGMPGVSAVRYSCVHQASNFTPCTVCGPAAC